MKLNEGNRRPAFAAAALIGESQLCRQLKGDAVDEEPDRPAEGCPAQAEQDWGQDQGQLWLGSLSKSWIGTAWTRFMAASRSRASVLTRAAIWSAAA